VLEHKPRYTRRSLKALLVGTGMDIEYVRWASATILMATFVVR